MDSEKSMNIVCYICGRSNDFLETLTSQQVTDIDEELKHLNNDLTQLTDKYGKLIQETIASIKDSNLHDVLFDTIKRDSSLRKKIPNCDDIISHFEDLREDTSKKTMEEICNLFNETIEEKREIMKIKDSISKLENKKVEIQLRLSKKQIKISKNSTDIEISICPICSTMFQEASSAAWRDPWDD